MACNRILVYSTAYLAFQTQISTTLLWILILILLYLIGLTFIAKKEVQLSFTGRWPTFCVLAPGLYFAWHLPRDWSWIFLLLFVLWIIWSLQHVRRNRIGQGIQQLIAGISLFDALVLVLMGATVSVWIAIVAFGLTLFLQRYVKGT